MDNFKKEECIVIGDSLRTDINPALKLGIDVIAVDFEFIKKLSAVCNKRAV